MRALTLFFVFLSLAVSCNREREREMKDTEGRVFSAKCNGDGCQLKQQSGPGDGKVSVASRGRLVAVCPETEGTAGMCRPLVCTTDGDCPPGQGLEHGTCVNALCIEPSHEVTPDDSVMLCLAGTGLGRNAPEQVERFALGLNCGSPCKVPRTCRQP